MNCKIKTFKRNEKSSYMLVIYENKALLRVMDYLPKHIKETEVDGELSGNNLEVYHPLGWHIKFDDFKIKDIKQSEYDKFLELYPEYRVKIENYQNWFKLQNNEQI